jgi:predicted DCC family thiol-disulfide oxidoreductase YuxK
MEKLYVLYDPKCELCERLKDWLLTQRTWIGLAMIPAGSEKARQMFPALDTIASDNDLVVVSDEGQVYLNDRAWIMAMFALEEYRDWACRLAHPLLMPLARQAFAAVSKNRYALSRWLRVADPEALAAEFRRVSLEPCAVGHETISDYLQ